MRNRGEDFSELVKVLVVACQNVLGHAALYK
uniref:Uncharacterized protein n=1 Tax=Coprothermobacter proteolyticus (strain ATCC 35245 / DSM 5265 / OCM 4 / BT) TaxID=309798 RepID=B5Y7P1_COPPD